MVQSRWGLIFASTFTGSLVGAGAPVFAVWSYALANGAGGRVDLHPALIGAQIGITREEAQAAIDYLCSPDPQSRSKENEGRRLLHVSGVVYEIVNYGRYNRRTSELREYNRAKQQESRARRGLSNQMSMLSTPSSEKRKEKTREEKIDPPIGSPRKRRTLWHTVPEDWKPTDKHRARTAHWPSGIFNRELEKFRNYEFPKGRSDANKAFFVWLAGAEERLKLAPPQPQPKKVDW